MKKIPIVFIVAIMFFIGGLGMLIVALKLPLDSPVTTIGGPGTFPALVLIVLIFFSGLLMLVEYRKMKNDSVVLLKFEKGDLKRILLVVTVSFIYLLVIEATGYLIATFGFTAMLLWLFGLRKKVSFAVITIVYPLIIFFVFKMLLKIPLP
ncbi:MAG: tripartite tricarboxylate transporter TctB family protein [Bacillota bacterium]|nr:tripartite tricarboxylate transporter TctB family protein [Bacillota bacterium]